MSNNNLNQPPNQNDNNAQQAAAMEAARAAINAGGDPLAAGGRGPNPNIQPNGSNIIANRSASPTTTSTTNNNNNNDNNLTPSLGQLKPPIVPKLINNPPPVALSGCKGIPGNNNLPKNVNNGGGSYPLPAYCNFVPGGISYKSASLVTSISSGGSNGGDEEEGMVHLSHYCSATGSSSTSPKGGRGRSHSRGLSIDTGAGGASSNKVESSKKIKGAGGDIVKSLGSGGPDVIIQKALVADASLRKYAVQFASSARAQSGSNNKTTTPGQRLPSLANLANSALVNPLTAVPSNHAVEWAEAMIFEYMDGRLEQLLSLCGNDEKNEASFKLNTEFDNVLRNEAGGNNNVINEDADELKGKEVLQYAILSAWAAEKAATGRTPTNKESDDDAPSLINDALTMELPSLKGLLKAIWRVQCGQDEYTNSSSGSKKDDKSKGSCFEGGPCGYVFRRGDIAWNCRTCQTDPTCVLCDECFRNSNHEGHEVFFHRTTPGGCCDCGDLEAWCVKGMCDRHCPPDALKEEVEKEGDEEKMGEPASGGDYDCFEAVKSAQRTRIEHERHVDGTPTNTDEALPFPPRFSASLSTIIGATIQSILLATESSAIGADVTQWRLNWSDEICKLWNGVGNDDEYYRRSAVLLGRLMDKKSTRGSLKHEEEKKGDEELYAHPRHLLDSHNEHYINELPANFNLFLRLHNDDVHTFEEVIKALHAKSHEPIPVPVGGKGSLGEIGGAGIRGRDIKASNGGNDDDAMAIMAEELSNSVTRSLRNRPLAEDPDSQQQQRRRARTGGSRSPTWNRSPLPMDHNEQSVALPPPLQLSSEVDPTAALVPGAERAQELTRKVDADGQVLVRSYETINGAGIGFSRLRNSSGLHCSVMTAARMESEERAKALLEWLGSLIGSHPAVGALVVQALVDVTEGEDVLCHENDTDNISTGIPGMSKGVAVWSTPRMMPSWSGTCQSWWEQQEDGIPAWRKRLDAFPPHLESSYLTREEGRELFRQGMILDSSDRFVAMTGVDPDFYANIPYSLPDDRLRKSPHALWGTLLSTHPSISSPTEELFTHPLLRKLTGTLDNNTTIYDDTVRLQQRVYVVDTDLRKHEEGESLTTAIFPHKMAGLNLISGMGYVDEHGSEGSHYFNNTSDMGVTSADQQKQILSCSSFIAPASPVLLLLLSDPYSPKNLRSCLHRLFLSLLTDSRFKSRFAASLGAISYRPTSTLFCAGIGTEADTLLGFTVQLFTTGSLVKALGNLDATKALLCREDNANEVETTRVSAMPIAHSVVRCIHSNILGATKEVAMAVKADKEESTAASNDSSRARSAGSISTSRSNMPPALVYQFGSEHPLSTRLPGAPDDKYIDSRCMKHKRLPHLLRDLEYIYETTGTALKLLRSGKLSSSTSNTPSASPTSRSGSDAINDTPSPSFTSPTSLSNSLATYDVPNALDFATVWARLLRLGQGIDLQKRKISGGHVEFEDERWLGAYGLSLNFSSTGDSLAESPFSSVSSNIDDQALGRVMKREAMGNLFAAFFREIKMWLFREGLLESGSRAAPRESGELEALQRSTLHVSASELDETSVNQIIEATGVTVAQSCDVACEKGVKNLPEAKLSLLEAALLHERTRLSQRAQTFGNSSSHGPLMGDWLKVPHSPLAGDAFSFHIPLHRALARSILCSCSAVVPEEERLDNPDSWWRLPVLDDDDDFVSGGSDGILFRQDTISALVRPTHKSSNFRVVWSSGPECSTPEAQLRKARSRMLSALLASTKVIHSLCDHPLRCIAASQQIDHHMWAKNGGSVAGMSLNYGSVPLCRSLRDIDLTMVQLSASGFNIGLGARRVFSLLTNRFSMDGYLCDPDRRNSFGKVGWVKPPRLQDPDHAELLAESFFTTLCVIVSDLPAPPPTSQSDNSPLRRNLRRELLHALAVEPRSHSEAMSAAAAAVSRRDESEHTGGGCVSSFRTVFTEVLQSIGQQRNQGSRSSSGPPMFELKPEGSHEYDPSFFHLRKTEHQHAMDNIARLRRRKLEAASTKGTASIMVLPLVSKPPQSHPRFLPSRLLLHLPSMHAAIRRYLMYVLFNGIWLPPHKPERDPEDITVTIDGSGGVSVPTFGSSPRSMPRRSESSMSNRSSVSSSTHSPISFSPETVAASSKSFLEVLHLLTLQVHTLEECGSLYKTLPFLDYEHKVLSSSISINSYLGQLIAVPKTLINVWALERAPYGPLSSKGSGENRGSVLGLLIALYEHRDNAKSTSAGQNSANDDHGGARVLSADGLKWLLRFVSALVEGAETVTIACESATSGIPISESKSAETSTIDPEICAQARKMLANLPELWPGLETESSLDVTNASAASEKSKEAQKAAQARALAKMKKLQTSFAASIESQFNEDSEKKLVNDDEENLCIICKCDDADGDNGPMGYLGHVQRSRVCQLASKSTLKEQQGPDKLDLGSIYRVVGDKGCQLRSTESVESAPAAFLPRGSVVEVLQSTMTPRLGLQSRRVLVRHVPPEGVNAEAALAQGWASIQSWQGYVILSPLSSLCYLNTRWGPTRPIIRQCGHAAHLNCVEAHCLSLHSRAAAHQPYDGRFSANIEDGEFLCPLCKQLSNIVIPEDKPVEADGTQTQEAATSASMREDKEGFEVLKGSSPADMSLVHNILVRKAPVSYSEASSPSNKATHQFGSSLSQAMEVSSDLVSVRRQKEEDDWHPALRRWDFEDDDQGGPGLRSPQIGSILRLMRQQLISWAAVGHSAAAAEASGRGKRQEMFGEVSYTQTDPWSDYSKERDSHPRLLELRRTLSASASLFDVVTFETGKQLGIQDEITRGETAPILGSLISDILDGQYWTTNASNSSTNNEWRVLTSIIASMMCHVSKEDTISSRRLEARAVAAAMWTITGSRAPLTSTSNVAMNLDESPEVEVNVSGNIENQESVESSAADDPARPAGAQEPRPVLPPKPLSVYRVERNLGVELGNKWGTSDPFSCAELQTPFRPAVASAFLYVPLLAWDLNILAGAVFSSLLANGKCSPCVSCYELLQSAKILLVGRLIQVLSTPGGFLTSKKDAQDDEFDDFDDEEQFWDDAKKKSEATAIKELLLFCRKSLAGAIEPSPQALDEETLLHNVGNAILPFARTIVLLLRASSSAIRQRHRRTASGNAEETQAEKDVAKITKDSDSMSIDNGFQLLDIIGVPLPSSILKVDSSYSSWISLVTRWVSALSGFEAYHGTRGNGLAFDTETKAWIPVASGNNDAQSATNSRSRGVSSLQNLQVETSGSAVEVAQLPQQGGDADGEDLDIDFAVESDDESSGVSNEDQVMEIVDDALAADSEEELEHVDDMDVDLEDFDDHPAINFGVVAPSSIGPIAVDADVDDASDVNASLSEPDGSKIPDSNDRMFSYVSRSAIIPYQPSILGLAQVGPGPRGARGDLFEYKVANCIMKDLSHLGSIHIPGAPLSCFIKLPKSFVELYSMVSRVKGRSDDADDEGGFETAICLLSGAVMRSGTVRKHRVNRPPGTCTQHARKVGSGIGIFFLVQKCTVLLMHNNKSAYSPSLYVDEHGEEDVGLRRGRPLFFSEERYQALETLWRTHGIPREVAQIRSTSDRVIRDNWY